MDENLENFDWNYYLENNEDLYLNGINSKEAALNHWINNGINENRPHKFINNGVIVDFKIYIEKFKFLEEKEYIKKEDAWNLTVIIFDKVYNNPYMEDINYFDWKYYIKNNTDLFDNNIISKEDVIEHWINFGKYENRNHKFTYNIVKDIDETIQNYINNINKNDINDMDINMYDMNNFDWKYYIKNNKDLIDGNIFTKEDAINHWNNFGKFEKRMYKFDNNINNESEEKNIIKTYSEKKYEKIEKIKENIKQQNKEIINEKQKEPFVKKHVINEKMKEQDVNENSKENFVKKHVINEKMKEQDVHYYVNENSKENFVKKHVINEKLKEQDVNDYVNENSKENFVKKHVMNERIKEQDVHENSKENFVKKHVMNERIKEQDVHENSKEQFVKKNVVNEYVNEKLKKQDDNDYINEKNIKEQIIKKQINEEIINEIPKEYNINENVKKNIDENLKEQILKEIINETLEEEKEHIQEETFNKASISL
jgi:hypothetical protein